MNNLNNLNNLINLIKYIGMQSILLQAFWANYMLIDDFHIFSYKISPIRKYILNVGIGLSLLCAYQIKNF